MSTRKTAFVIAEALAINGCHVTYMCPSVAQAEEAAAAYRDHCSNWLMIPSDLIHFVSCMDTGCAVLHTPVLILEDSHQMNHRCWQEAKLIAAPENHWQPAIIEVTSS